MKKQLHDIVDYNKYPLDDPRFRGKCKTLLGCDGLLVLERFLLPGAINLVLEEALEKERLAYYCVNEHNVFLTPQNSDFPVKHPQNLTIKSSKGCITDDQVPAKSALRILYNSAQFQEFLCAVLEEQALYEYKDPLSSINVHYAREGQELGWHFDNSSFAITLLIQKPESGGSFEYIRDFRKTENNEINYEGVEGLLQGNIAAKKLDISPGSLVLFRGRDAIHRVTPVEGDSIRILSVLAYNSKPGVSLSESARMTFFGRLN